MELWVDIWPDPDDTIDLDVLKSDGTSKRKELCKIVKVQNGAVVFCFILEMETNEAAKFVNGEIRFPARALRVDGECRRRQFGAIKFVHFIL